LFNALVQNANHIGEVCHPLGNVSPCMKCAECARHLAEFERLERAYAAAIYALISIRETTTRSEYPRLRRLDNEARLDAEMARLELIKHKWIHSKAN
jgi:hypothetical protein